MSVPSPYKDPRLSAVLLAKLQDTLAGREMRFMEVCGTHTCAIFQSGLRSLLPKNIKHISGPGCPVCVTHEAEIALLWELSREKNLIIATFGDLLRVPGPQGKSLKNLHAEGCRVSIVYSALDALKLAKDNPNSEVVFLGVGFETTAPTVAASILNASQAKVRNFSVLSFHKLVPPALRRILSNTSANIDAFLLPGHVATITGLEPFNFVAEEFGRPGVVGGFEVVDILFALQNMAEELIERTPLVKNAYTRAVSDKGNPHALELMNKVFERSDALWRGLGMIPESGLAIREEYALYDAMRKFQLRLTEAPASPCKCGEILQGLIDPPQCPLFGKKCTPANPIGPCMVSTEGTCAAYYKYGE